MDNLRAIISGGGTGGHIFPALSIAGALKEAHPEAEILFVGAEGRMEMERVPQAGYAIKGLPVAGFDRKRPWRNVSVIWKLLKSRRQARRILREFRPDVVIGVGGYASGPTLDQACKLGIPTLVQEQNSYAGVTNRLLARRADRFCVAYEGMERFFPKEKIRLTGNPVRQSLLAPMGREAAAAALGTDPALKTVLIIGGSLGARTVNESVLSRLELIRERKDVQFVWQTGGYYSASIREQLEAAGGCPENLLVSDFISEMGAAYAAADLVVSRAGASSISELQLLGKPAILVPSPNVAEDHQTKNALALTASDAALCVPDAEAEERLVELAIATVTDEARLRSLGTNIRKLAKPDAAADIAREAIRLAKGVH